jgi:hypothetical protein
MQPGGDVVTPGDGGGADAQADVQRADSTPTGDVADVAMDVPAATDVQGTDAMPTGDAMPVGDGGAGGCAISADVATHTALMATTGWSALNRSRALMMYGCGTATRPQDCLATVPLADATNIGPNRSAVTGAHLRVMYTSTNRSNYWTRSSPDGRFVGRGTHIHDMVRGVEVEASGAMYDPGFFPDNNGFAYQPGGRLCPMSALTTGTPTSVLITGTGSPCAGSTLGLYEHLGASLAGGDYWATAAGTAAWDDGGHMATLTETRRNEAWGATAQTTLTLMANTGSGFMAVGSRSVTTPFQGDAVISPSSTLLMARFVDNAGVYQGYVLHALDASHAGAAITATTREIARYCTVGAKPAFSLDERWVVYHHYLGGGPSADDDARDLGFTGASDPMFAAYATQGASNIYLLDLATGVRTRVTTMGPGQYALYPHFRSDGWVYFTVRTLGTSVEYIVASDAALLMP